MKFIFACGGTAGHINPAIGVAGRIKELMPDSQFLFIGAKGKMETELVPREGYPFKAVAVSNLSRSLTGGGIKHNLKAVKELSLSMPACKKIIKEFQPDAVIGTGGYVCFPVLHEAAKLGIPTLVHESNAKPGLTTKLLEKSARRIMVGFEEAKANYSDPAKVYVTGTPVRLDFLRWDKKSARKELGIPEHIPLVVSVWGSLGATDMNRTVAEMISLAMPDRPFRMIHSAGKRGIEGMESYLRDQLGLSGWNEAGFEVKDYIYDMPLVMAAADLVLCRSGASTLAELAAMGKPAILVPSPNVVHNHQEVNARVLENGGAAKILLEKDATPEAMLNAITTLLSDPERLARMSRNMRAKGVEDATDKIASMVISLAME